MSPPATVAGPVRAVSPTLTTADAVPGIPGVGMHRSSDPAPTAVAGPPPGPLPPGALPPGVLPPRLGPAASRAAAPAVLDEVRAELVERGGPNGPAEIAAAIRATGRVRGDREVLALVVTLQAELTGAGPLQPLLREVGVTDVLVNAPDQVWVDRGRGLELTGVRFGDEAAVRRLAQRLAAQAGRRLDEASPWVDAPLPDGSRLHAVLPPIAVAGTAISLRVPPRRTFTLAELVTAGSFPASGAALLRRLVTSGAGFLLSGGTGSGKTTLLSCLLGEVPAGHRVVIIEDSRELVPTHPHVVSLQGRPPNVEGSGGVRLADLVRQALRMRPDRVVGVLIDQDPTAAHPRSPFSSQKVTESNRDGFRVGTPFPSLIRLSLVNVMTMSDTFTKAPDRRSGIRTATSGLHRGSLSVSTISRGSSLVPRRPSTPRLRS